MAAEQGLPYLILDGTLISSNRCADKKTSRKGKETGKWYSGKAHQPAGNVQALAAPGGVPLWVSDVLPGSTHDLTAARDLVLPGTRPYLKDLLILADSGYEGARPAANHGQPDHDRRHREIRTRPHAIRAQDDQLKVAEKTSLSPDAFTRRPRPRQTGRLERHCPPSAAAGPGAVPETLAARSRPR